MPFLKPLPKRCCTALGLFLLVFSLTTCAFRPRSRELSVKVDPKLFREALRRLSLSDLNCFFVSVTGPGVTYDFGPLKLGTRDPACMGIGRTSDLVSLSTLTSKGVLVRTSGGPSRLVRVLGAKSTLSSCDDLPLSALFDNRQPEVFEVGSALVDAYTDRKVEVAGPSVVAKSNDIVKPCDFTGVPSGDGYQPVTPPSASSARLAVYLRDTTGNNYLRTYPLASNGQVLSTGVQQVAITLNYTKPQIRVRPDGRAFYLTSTESPTNSVYKVFPIDGNGSIDYTVSEGSLGHPTNYLDFSANSANAYSYSSAERGLRQISVTPQGFSPILPVCGLNEDTRVIPTLNRIYLFDSASAGIITVSAVDNLCSSGAISSRFAGPLRAYPRYIYFAANGSLYTMETELTADALYRRAVSSGGGWGDEYEAGPGFAGGTSEVEMLTDESGLVVAAPVLNSLSLYKFGAGGSFIGSTSASTSVQSPTSLTVDPLRRMVYVISDLGTSLRQYDIQNGGLTEVPFSFSLGANIIYAIRAIPIR